MKTWSSLAAKGRVVTAIGEDRPPSRCKEAAACAPQEFILFDEKTPPQAHRRPLNHTSGGYAVIKSLLRGAWRVHLRGRCDQNQRELEVL